MLILLSPAKTQDFEEKAPTRVFTQPEFLDESKLLVKELQACSQAKLSSMMTISDDLAKLNRGRYKTFKTPFTLSNAKQAVFAFQGDVYDGLKAETFDSKALDFAQAHLRILSGLYGVLRPLDLIQPYRLEMKTRLSNPRGKNLYAFWGDRITEALRHHIAHLNPRVIINLASQEYAKAVDLASLGRVITPQFMEKRGPHDYQMVALFAKKARGTMARYICENRILVPEALQFFAEDDYRLNVALSKPDAPVYTREEI